MKEKIIEQRKKIEDDIAKIISEEIEVEPTGKDEYGIYGQGSAAGRIMQYLGSIQGETSNTCKWKPIKVYHEPSNTEWVEYQTFCGKRYDEYLIKGFEPKNCLNCGKPIEMEEVK